MTLEVIHCSGERIGRLADDPTGRIFFQYDQAWLERGCELSPFHLPLGLGRAVVGHHERYGFQGLFGLFADSLPQGWGRKLLDRRLTEAGLNPRSVGSLVRLGFLGDRAMGALSFRPDQDPAAQSTWEAITLAQVDEEAQRFARGDAESESLRALISAGTSPGGARPKVLALVRGSVLRLSSGTQAGWEPWIVKLSEGEQAEAGRIEFAYAEMARAAGLTLPETRLFDGRFFGVRRFDREGLQKFHVHTLGGLLQVVDGSYQDLARTALELVRDHRALDDVFLRAAFNIGAFVRDDHLLNVAFLQTDTGAWRLAPCYDLTPNDLTRIPPGHAMTLGGQVRPTAAHLLALGREFQVPDAPQMLEKVRAALARWPEFAARAGVEPRSSRAVEELLSEGQSLLRPPVSRPRRSARRPAGGTGGEPSN